MASVARRYGTDDKTLDAKRAKAQVAPVVLMVSGGADSCALLVKATREPLNIEDGRGEAYIAQSRLHVLHVNHGLRGLDADEDEEFVGELCHRFNLAYHSIKIDVAKLAHSDEGENNVENIGRQMRYAEADKLLNRLCDELEVPRSAGRILTAHTANDRAETFLMNAIRGSGVSGLSGIARRRNRIVRPLLDATHEELCTYLRTQGIIWHEDVTNQDTTYFRNYVRKQVLPTMLERNPKSIQNIATSCDILSDEEAFLVQLTKRSLRDITRRKGEGTLALDAMRLAASDVAIARRVVRQAILEVVPEARLEAKHINRTLELVAQGSGSTTVPMGCHIHVEFGLLFIRSAHNEAMRAEIYPQWLDIPGSAQVPLGSIRARLVRLKPGKNAQELARIHALEWDNKSVLLDAESLGIEGENSTSKLWLDSWEPGDIMCPLGMHGQSRAISDMMAQVKIPVADRKLVPIIRTSHSGQVLWLAGIRPDDRFCARPNSSLLLELTYFTSTGKFGIRKA